MALREAAVRFQARDFSPNKWPLFSSVLLMMLFWRWGLAQGAGGLPVRGWEGGKEVGARGLTVTVTVTSDARHLHCSWSSVQPPKDRPAKGCEVSL